MPTDVEERAQPSFSMAERDRRWAKLPFALPSGTSLVTADGKDNGLRFVDVDEDGNGLLEDGRLYGLVLEHGTVRDRVVQISFDEPGAEAYSFTFG